MSDDCGQCQTISWQSTRYSINNQSDNQLDIQSDNQLDGQGCDLSSLLKSNFYYRN